MGLILGILLILLGVISAESFIASKVPGSNNIVSKLNPYQETIGICALVLSLLFLIEWLSWLPHLGAHGWLALINILLAFALGLIFGLEVVRRNLRDPNVSILPALEMLRIKLLPLKELLGLAAIIFGLLGLVV